MKKNIHTAKFLWCCALVVSFSFLGRSQTVNDVSLRGLRTVHQNSFINPSWLSDTNILGEYRASTGFHFGADLRSNYLVINDVFRSLNDNNTINIFRLLNKAPSTFAYTGITANVGTGFTTMYPLRRAGHLSLTIGYQVKMQAALNADGLEGRVFRNATRVEVDNKNIGRAMAWGEFSLGLSGSYGAIDYGVRAKYLIGLAYFTDNWNVDAQLLEDTLHINTNNSRYMYNYIGNSQGILPPFIPIGHGVGFDFGLTLHLSRKTSIDFSLVDVGVIGWSSATPPQVVHDNLVAGYFNASFNTVGDVFVVSNNSEAVDLDVETRDTVINAITPLYSQFALGITHDINTHWRIGAVYHRINAPAAFKYAVSVYGSYRFLRNWEATINTGLREGSISAIGMGLSYTSRKFQAFVTTENIIPAFGKQATYSAKNINIVFGVNFRVGSKSLKLLGPVVLCPDPIVDETDQAQRKRFRKGFMTYNEKARKGLKYNEKNPDGILKIGKKNKNKRSYRNSYSEIISSQGEEGGNYDKVDFIGDELKERQLPDYNVKPIEIKPQDDKISKQGESGDYYNEKGNIPLPKRQIKKEEKEKKKKNKKDGFSYGEKGSSKKKEKKAKGVSSYGSKGRKN